MHLLIPHASALGEEATEALAALQLPKLAALLGRLRPEARVGSDEFSAGMPHELALAALRGEPPARAAWRATEVGLPGNRPWALLTPLHLAVSLDQVRAHAAELSDADSHQLFDSLAELWPVNEGWLSHWVTPSEWLLSHESLAGIASASVDRVIQRNIAPWLPEARRLRSLQNEVQMLLHRHPLNEVRAMPVNSVWISGCGTSSHALPADVKVDARLREPLLAGDWPAWQAAWHAIDADLPALTRITLCGERFAQTFGPAGPNGLFKRIWQQVSPPRTDIQAVLGDL